MSFVRLERGLTPQPAPQLHRYAAVFRVTVKSERIAQRAWLFAVAASLYGCGSDSGTSVYLSPGEPPGEIVSVGQNSYKLRVTNEPEDVAAAGAVKRANEYCAGMNQSMLVVYKAFDMGYGYTLTWSCVPPNNRWRGP